MLEKTTNATYEVGVIGERCIEFAPPPQPPPPKPVPRPPVPGTDPPAGPSVGEIISIDTYQDTLGNCWRVATFSTAPTFGSTLEATPIDCGAL